MQRRGLMLLFALGYGLIAAALVLGAWVALQHAWDARHGLSARLGYGFVGLVCLYGVHLAVKLARRMMELRRGGPMIEPAGKPPERKPPERRQA